MVDENAFGRLKGRWRRLLKRIDSKLLNVPNIVASRVTLHNICEIYGDHCSNEWFVDKGGTTVTPIHHSDDTYNTASDVRNAIKDFL